METVSRETSPWYVTGLIDGIGAFTYSRSGSQLAVYFAVKAANGAVLSLLRDFFAVGAIYPSGRSRYYRVQRRNELSRIVDHFDRYPLQLKQTSYEIWREMVLAKQEFRRPNRSKLAELAERLSAASR